MSKRDIYEVLGISRDADDKAIKSAYRKLAMKHHPDKGGDQDLFKKMTEAFQVLSNEDKRKLYDSGGKEAVAAGVDRSNIFNMFNNNNASLMKMINEITDAKIEDGGGGAFYIFLKKNKSIK